MNGWPLLCLAAASAAAQPVETVWIRAGKMAGASGGVARIRPDVHSVEIAGAHVLVRSAGISLAYLGPLQNEPRPRQGLVEFAFRLPRSPREETGRRAHIPEDHAGVFVNGLPIPNHFEAASYRGQNIWHYDAVARNDDGTVTAAGRPRPGLERGAAPGLLEGLIANTGRHSPIIGYALDGYPVYGPWTAAGRARSSYVPREMAARDRLPDGTTLAPGQIGPPVGPEYPLGTFVEDYVYTPGAGDLDEFNGRHAITPEYPDGTYAYFLATDERGKLAFPYLLAHEFRGHVDRPEPSRERFDTSGPLRAGRPAVLRFRFPDARGRPIRHLEYVHERPVHVLAISHDRKIFAHIHPRVTDDGVWEVSHTFPRAGRYRVYAEFTPPGGNQRLEFHDVTVSGPRAGVAEAPRPSGIAIEGVDQLTAGEDVELRFRPASAIRGWQPYLGAWAHVVIAGENLSSLAHAHPVEEGSSKIAASEAHVHASEAPGPPPAVLRVAAVFPRVGSYRLWLQLQVDGQVRTIPFEVTVRRAGKSGPATAIPAGAIRLSVTPGGFEPQRLRVPAGRAVTLAITRSADPNCGATIVFPGLGLTRELRPGQVTLVELPSRPAGEFGFACGMGMYRGSLVVQ